MACQLCVGRSPSGVSGKVHCQTPSNLPGRPEFDLSYRRGRDLAETVGAKNNNANAGKADKSKLAHDKFPGERHSNRACQCLS